MFKQKTVFKHGESVKVHSFSFNNSQPMECSDGEGVEMQLTPDNVEPDQCNVDSSDNNEPPRKRSKLDNDISDRVKRSYIG